MPNKPKKVVRSWETERTPFGRRNNNNYKFYNSTKWRKKSRSYRESNPFCVPCQREGVSCSAQVVDHVKGLQFLLDNGLDPFDNKELEGMCHKQHNKKSGKQSHGTDKGYGVKTHDN